MNDNVKIADDVVAKVRKILASATDKKLVPIRVEDLLECLQAVERLSILERHLYNLTSNGYKLYA